MIPFVQTNYLKYEVACNIDLDGWVIVMGGKVIMRDGKRWGQIRVNAHGTKNSHKSYLSLFNSLLVFPILHFVFIVLVQPFFPFEYGKFYFG